MYCTVKCNVDKRQLGTIIKIRGMVLLNQQNSTRKEEGLNLQNLSPVFLGELESRGTNCGPTE